MAKKEDPPPAGAPAWTATFGDLMNLLLCFFVLLFSMSTMDAQKFEEVAASFSSAFGIFKGGENAFGEGALIGDGISQLNELSNYMVSMGVNQTGESQEISEQSGEFSYENTGNGDDMMSGIGTQGNGEANNSAENTEQFQDKSENQEIAEAEQLKASEELAEKIKEALNEAQIESDVELNFTSQYVQLTLQGAILFDSGDTRIKDEAYPILEKVGQILERYAGGTIEIEGHTDNVPMHRGGKYANNDELSDGRALSIFYYLLETTTLDPARIMHTGRGEYDPIADNSTPEGRARNRRVEIRIYNPLSPMY